MNFTKIKISRSQNLQKGFSLLETMVALFIFSVAVVAMFVVLGNDLRNVNYAKKQITATYLASEGIELVRSMRDTYTLYDSLQVPAVNGWDQFKGKFFRSGCTVGNNKCYIDIDHSTSSSQSYNVFYNADVSPITKVLVGSCSTPQTCPTMYYHSSTGRYDYLSANGVETDFRRSISVQFLGTDEVLIISSVSWGSGLSAKSVTFYENLFNHIP